MVPNLEGSNFLVTGGSGFIGSNLATFLINNGAGMVRVLDNLSNGHLDNLKHLVGLKNFEFVNGDICDLNTCVRCLDNIHYVSHQAALGSVPRSINDPLASSNVNIIGFLNILVAVRDSPSVKRMTYASSSSVYGNNLALPKIEEALGQQMSPYAITKYVDELFAENFSAIFGLHTVGLRYFNVFGPRQSPTNPYAAVIPLFFRAAIENQPPVINGNGNTSRDFTYVDNAVQANVLAMLNTPDLDSHQAVNIAVGKMTSLNDLWKMISRLANSNAEPKYGNERPGDIKASLADISKAKKLFGYDPEIDIQQGLEISYKWYKDNYYE